MTPAELEALATQAAEKHGLPIEIARAVVRLSLIQVARDVGVSQAKIAAYAAGV